MNQSDFFESEIYGVHWGMLPMPSVPKDEPEVSLAKSKRFEKLLFPVMEQIVDFRC